MLETRLEQDQIMFCEQIKSSTEGLLVLINDIVDLTKIESGILEQVIRIHSHTHTNTHTYTHKNKLLFLEDIYTHTQHACAHTITHAHTYTPAHDDVHLRIQQNLLPANHIDTHKDTYAHTLTHKIDTHNTSGYVYRVSIYIHV